MSMFVKTVLAMDKMAVATAEKMAALKEKTVAAAEAKEKKEIAELKELLHLQKKLIAAKERETREAKLLIEAQQKAMELMLAEFLNSPGFATCTEEEVFENDTERGAQC